MARPKKGEDKPKADPKMAQVHVNIEDFVKTRDSVVTGLATLQNAVQDLSRSYIAHTNTVLGRPLGTPLSLPPLDENAILNLRTDKSAEKVEAGQSKDDKDDKEIKEEKKEKKKRERDPNMPKRPLTAYFLYMKSARSVVAKDLPKANPGQIAEEGTRRWKQMTDEEKQLWRAHYIANLKTYNEEVKKYKAEKGEHAEIDDDAAAQLAAEGAAAEEADSELEKEAMSDDDVDQSDDKEKQVPPKTPSPPKSPKTTKRRKLAKDSSPKPAAPAAPPKETPILPPTMQTPVPLPGTESKVESTEAPGTKSPEKRKRTTKKAKAGAEAVKEEAKDIEEPKSSSKADSQDSQKKEPRTRKKRKSSATGA
ncbi:MAG: hypothetical protein M1836_005350 [Candelina mexicana]|nr:MAG: hypothetical protein M1836_005350 [Candelina mexicana]